MRYKVRRDRFSRDRGGSSQLLDISCANCATSIALYQKDGPGALKRMYLDRILAPENVASACHSYTTKAEMPPLRCAGCENVVGTSMVYEPEDRLAYRLIPGTFAKSTSDGIYPPANEGTSEKDE